MMTRIYIIILVFFSLVESLYSHQNELKLEKYIDLLEKIMMLDKEQLDRIWDGFNLNDLSIGIYNDNITYLVNHPEPGARFSSTGRSMQNNTLFFADSSVFDLKVESTRNYNDYAIAIIKADENLPVEEFCFQIFYEVFHSFSDSVSSLAGRYGDITMIPFFPSTNPPFYAFADIEQQILEKAFSTDNEADLGKLIEEYYHISFRRANMVSERIRNFEYQTQVHEGLAIYAGLKGLEIMGYGEYARNKLQGMLIEPAEIPEDFEKRNHGVGAALAYILDRIYVDWKNDFDQLTNLSDMLRVRITPTDRLDAENLMYRYQYEAKKALYHRKLYRNRAKLRTLRKSIMSFNRIDIVFPEDIRMTLHFDPPNITSIHDTLLFHEKYLRLIRLERFDIEMNGIPGLTEVVHQNMFLVKRLSVGIPDKYEITFDGTKFENNEYPVTFKELLFRSEKFNMQLLDGTIKRERDNIIFDLRKKR